MNNEMLKTDEILKKWGLDGKTLSAFAESLVRNLPISSDSSDYRDWDEFQDIFQDYVHAVIDENLPLLDIDYGALMQRSVSELGGILYDLDKYGYIDDEKGRIYYCPAFLGEDAKKSFLRILDAYIRINYVAKEEELSLKEIRSKIYPKS